MNKIKNIEKKLIPPAQARMYIFIEFPDGTYKYENEFFPSVEAIYKKYPSDKNLGAIILPAKTDDHSNIN